MGWGKRTPGAWIYTVVMASNRKPAASVLHWRAACWSVVGTPRMAATPATRRLASPGAQASVTWSNASASLGGMRASLPLLPPSLRAPASMPCACACRCPCTCACALRCTCQRPPGSGNRPVTRSPACTQPPARSSQCTAAWGNKAPKSVRGSSRLEPPRPLNRLSCKTRKNTSPLAACAGVFNADTHRGSMNCAISRGVRPAHRSATDRPGAHTKPRSRHIMAVRIRASLSRQLQPRAVAMPHSASKGGAASGSASPWPSGYCSASGMRSSAVSGSTPTSRMSRRLSAYAPMRMCWPLSRVMGLPPGSAACTARARPPTVRAVSNTVTWRPACVCARAAAIPAQPAPITATFMPVPWCMGHSAQRGRERR